MLWEYLRALEPRSDSKIQTSTFEEHYKDLFYRGKEVAHTHPSDGSLHVYLSAPDCETVIKSQWGGM